MKIIILYGSTNGTTKRIVSQISAKIDGNSEILNVKEYSQKKYNFNEYDLLIFVSPTYGDEELQCDMELFFQDFQFDLSGKKCIICETGNYYGYDNFQFGAGKIMNYHLKKLKADLFFESLSLDTLPRIDWSHLNKWIDALNVKLKK